MCGSLKLEGHSKFTPIRNFISAVYLTENHHGLTEYKWDGFARSDGSADGIKTMMEQWTPDIWTPEILRVEAFIERNRKTREEVEFETKRIVVIIAASGQLKIVTRPARTKDEVLVHHRMPMRIPAIMTRKQFIHDFNRLTNSDYH